MAKINNVLWKNGLYTFAISTSGDREFDEIVKEQVTGELLKARSFTVVKVVYDQGSWIKVSVQFYDKAKEGSRRF